MYTTSMSGLLNTTFNHTMAICRPPYEKDRLLLVVLYSIVIAVGVPANLVTVYLNLLQVQRKNVLGIYLFSLSLCDLMYLGSLPFWAIYINNGHCWPFSTLACKLVGYIFFNNMYISILLLCCVSVDRYVAVVYALESRGLRQQRQAVLITMGIVAMVALVHTPVFTMSEGEVESSEHKRCFEPGQTTLMVTAFNYARFLVGFCLPLCILSVTNRAILAEVEASVALKAQQKVKVRCLAFAVVLLFLLCFAPYHVILLLRAISFNQTQEECHFELSVYTPYTMSLGLSTINSAVNPILYVLASDNVRKELRRGLLSLRSGSGFGPSSRNSEAQAANTQ